MTGRIAGPSLHVSEQPPTTAVKHAVGGCSEALIKCCALALEYRQLLTVQSRDHVDTLVARAMWTRTHEQALRWRQVTFQTTWQTRWRWAVEAVRSFFPELPGVSDLPDVHWDAGLPEIASAGVT